MIREYRPTDQSAIEAIYLDSFPQYTIDALREHMVKGKTWVYVKNRNNWGKVLGYIIMESNYLSQVAVHEEQRGKGVGRELISFAEKMCSLQSPMIWLHCLANNPAFLLYERCGYKVKEFIKNLYGRGFDGYVMQKTF